MPELHAKYSPSGASRWTKCTASIRAAQTVPPRPSSAYADDGTRTHTVCERVLNAKPIERPDVFDAQVQAQKIDGDLIDYARSFIDLVEKEFEAQFPDWIQIEARLETGTSIHPDCWGTGDVVAFYPDRGRVKVGDLKTGAGLIVSADTLQLVIYGFGAALRYQEMYGSFPDKVDCYIHQPAASRRYPTKTHTWDMFDLLDKAVWLRSVIIGIEMGDVKFEPGEHCRFCDYLAHCPHARALVMDAIGYEISGHNPERMPTDEQRKELGQFMEYVDLARKWCDAVQATATAWATLGADIPGWVLEEGRANRKFKDEAAFKAWADKLGLDPYEQPKLSSPAQMEKKIGTKNKPLIEELNLEHVIKPQGKLKLVPDEGDGKGVVPAAKFKVTAAAGQVGGFLQNARNQQKDQAK